MNTVVKILMDRDGMTEEEAKDMVREAQERVSQGENPEEILHSEFGLEPDYIFDILGG